MSSLTDNLRLTIVGPLPPPAGGMANQTRYLTERFAAEGTAVEVAPTNAPYRPAWIGGLRGLRALFRLGAYLPALWRAAGRSDVFHVMANSGWSWHLFAAPAVRIARMRGVPVVVNYRGGEAETFFQTSFPRVRRTLERCQAVVVPSTYLQEVFGKFDWPVAVIPNPVDLERFAPGRPEERNPERPHLIFTRNLEAIYGPDVVLRAFRMIYKQRPDARLTLAGSGPERETLQGLALELGVADATTFAGRLGRDSMAGLYRSADLLLNASRADNNPNALVEAMAAQVPIVSSDVGGIPHLVTDGETALLVPPNDARALADAALTLLEDPDLAGRLRKNGADKVRAFAWERVGAAWYGLYGKLLTGRSAGDTLGP